MIILSKPQGLGFTFDMAMDIMIIYTVIALDILSYKSTIQNEETQYKWEIDICPNSRYAHRV